MKGYLSLLATAEASKKGKVLVFATSQDDVDRTRDALIRLHANMANVTIKTAIAPDETLILHPLMLAQALRELNPPALPPELRKLLKRRPHARRTEDLPPL